MRLSLRTAKATYLALVVEILEHPHVLPPVRRFGLSKLGVGLDDIFQPQIIATTIGPTDLES